MLALAAIALCAPVPAGAQEASTVDVVEIKGRIDPIVTDFIRRAIARADESKSEVLVIQLNSPGVLIGGAFIAGSFFIKHWAHGADGAQSEGEKEAPVGVAPTVDGERQVTSPSALRNERPDAAT